MQRFGQHQASPKHRKKARHRSGGKYDPNNVRATIARAMGRWG